MKLALKSLGLFFTAALIIFLLIFVKKTFKENNKGVALYNKGSFGDAAELFGKVLESKPNDFDVIKNAAAADYKSGVKNKSQERYEQITKEPLAMPKDRFDAFYALGNLAYQDGDLEKAADFYKEALRIKPSDMDAKYNLEKTLKKQAQKHQQEQDKNQNQQQNQNQQDQQQNQSQQNQDQQNQQQNQNQQDQQQNQNQQNQNNNQSQQQKQNDKDRQRQQDLKNQMDENAKKQNENERQRQEAEGKGKAAQDKLNDEKKKLDKERKDLNDKLKQEMDKQEQKQKEAQAKAKAQPDNKPKQDKPQENAAQAQSLQIGQRQEGQKDNSSVEAILNYYNQSDMSADKNRRKIPTNAPLNPQAQDW